MTYPPSNVTYEGVIDKRDREFFDLMVGGYIGGGMSRRVFYLRQDLSKVIKFEHKGVFQNVLEHKTWDHVGEVDWHREWFCPVVDISGSGSFLVMEYARPLQPHELPERIPFYLTDTKASNWGWYKGRPVCVDYGFHLLWEKGMARRMVKANWWNPHDASS